MLSHREQQATFRSIRLFFRATCLTIRPSCNGVHFEMSVSIFIGAGSIGLGLVLVYLLWVLGGLQLL